MSLDFIIDHPRLSFLLWLLVIAALAGGIGWLIGGPFSAPPI